MFHVFGKSRLSPGKSTPHIIGPFALFNKVQIILYDQGIRTLVVGCPAHSVVDFRPSVDAEDYVLHIGVNEVPLFFIQEQAVCGDCETNILSIGFLRLTAIGNQLLTTSKFISGSPPKKSISKLWRVPE